jgi:hypothetical protein
MSTPQVRFIIDNAGHKSSVVVPYRQWEKFNSNYHKLLNKIRVLTGIKEGFREVTEAQKTGKKLQKLSAFLNESRS